MLQLEYEPEGVIENVATFVGVPELDIEKDMARFVEFVEKRGAATGGWRGQIANADDAKKTGTAGQGSL
jgi:hypothetical protein